MPGVFDRLVNAVAQRGLAFGEELITWMGSVQAHAIAKWTPVVAAELLCARDNARGPCHQQAVAACLVCREAVCLKHACIAANADVACTRCMHDLVTKAIEEREAAGPPPPASRPSSSHRHGADAGSQAPPPRQGPPPLHPLEERRLRSIYLTTLQLAEGASEEDLRKAHRKLSGKWHPDKYETKKDKADALEQYKRIQVAFDWLKNYGTRARAA